VAASRLMTSARALRLLWRDEEPNPQNGQRKEPMSGLGRSGRYSLIAVGDGELTQDLL
jgi:hypothetical protein